MISCYVKKTYYIYGNKIYNMFYQLPTGKVIEISVDQYLDMTDEEIEYLVAYNYGDAIENPWHGSILTKQGKEVDDSELPLDLIDTSEVEKLSYLDTDDEINEE